MGFFSFIPKIVGKIFGFAKPIVQNTISDNLTNRISSTTDSVTNKVLGVPTPSTQGGLPETPQKTPSQLGADQDAYNKAAYPGLDPWERLGISGGGAQLASAMATGKIHESMQRNEIVNAQKMQQRELNNRIQIAKDNNRVVAMGHGSPFGVQAARSMLELYDGKGQTPVKEFDTPTQQARERLPSEIEKTRTSTPYGTGRKIAEDISDAIKTVGQLPPTIMRIQEMKKIQRKLEERKKEAEAKYGTLEQQRKRKNK